MIGDGVELALKTPEELDNLEVFKSYTRILSPEIEKNEYSEYNLLDKIYEMFLYASGQRFLPALTMAKFSKIAKIFSGVGNKPISKFDVDVCYKKMVGFHEQLDFYAFLDSIDFLIQKCFIKSELDEEKKLRIVIENFEKVMSKKKDPVGARRKTKKKKNVDMRAKIAKGMYMADRDKAFGKKGWGGKNKKED